MGNAPDALLRLVDRFSQDHKVFLSGGCKEEQPRAMSDARLARHILLPKETQPRPTLTDAGPTGASPIH